MNLSPEDLGHLARLLPFVIAVLAWLWKRSKSPASTPSAPRTRLTGAESSSKASSLVAPEPARFTGPGPIEPR